MERKIIVERLNDWNYGAFLNETDTSCIAIGSTEQEARESAKVRIDNEEIVGKIMQYIASFNIQNPTYDRIKAILKEQYIGISRS